MDTVQEVARRGGQEGTRVLPQAPSRPCSCSRRNKVQYCVHTHVCCLCRQVIFALYIISYQRPPTSSLGYLAPSSSGHYRHPMMMQQPVVSSYLPMDPSMEEQLQEDYFSVGGFATVENLLLVILDLFDTEPHTTTLRVLALFQENHHQLQHLHPPSASLQLTPSQEGTVLMLTGDNDIEEEEEEEKEIFKEIMMTLIKTVKEEEKEDGQEGGLEMEDEENKVKNLKAPWKSTKPVRAITFLDEVIVSL